MEFWFLFRLVFGTIELLYVFWNHRLKTNLNEKSIHSAGVLESLGKKMFINLDVIFVAVFDKFLSKFSSPFIEHKVHTIHSGFNSCNPLLW